MKTVYNLPLYKSTGECVTVKELKDWLQKFPDTGEVWIEIGSGRSSPVVTLIELNDGDVILESAAFD